MVVCEETGNRGQIAADDSYRNLKSGPDCEVDVVPGGVAGCAEEVDRAYADGRDNNHAERISNTLEITGRWDDLQNTKREYEKYTDFLAGANLKLNEESNGQDHDDNVLAY
jgi:hypothetical protein